MARYIVTGGAGFIGSHLVDRLLKDGNKVVVIDNFSEGKLSNLPKQLETTNLSVFNVSILDETKDLFRGVDVVFHLAALTRPQESIERPKLYNETNVDGTLNVLQNARDCKVKRVVFASSASVYGEQQIYPCLETAKPNPLSPYALQKLIGEQYCQLFEKIYGLETNCMRFFNVYGPKMNPDSSYAALIPGFVKKMKKGIKPTIFNDGNQARDFVYVDDVVEALVKAATSKVHGEIFNVGTETNFSVNQIFEMIRGTLGMKIKAVYGPKVIEPSQTLASKSKISEMLNWEPKVQMADGIEQVIPFYG